MIKIIDGDLLASKTDIIAPRLIAKVLLTLVLQGQYGDMMFRFSMIIVRTAPVKRQMIL